MPTKTSQLTLAHLSLSVNLKKDLSSIMKTVTERQETLYHQRRISNFMAYHISVSILRIQSYLTLSFLLF